MSDFEKQLDIDVKIKDSKLELSYEGNKIGLISSKILSKSDSSLSLYVAGNADKSTYNELYGCDADGNRGEWVNFREINDISADSMILSDENGAEEDVSSHPGLDKGLIEELVMEILYNEDSFWEEC